MSEQGSKRSIVIGNGWSALAVILDRLHQGGAITWIKGSGTHLGSPVDVVEPAGLPVLHQMAAQVGFDLDAPVTGSFLREFKNKTFRIPHWLSEDDQEMMGQARDAFAWGAERSFIVTDEARLSSSLSDLDNAIRDYLSEHEGIERVIVEVPVTALRAAKKNVKNGVEGRLEGSAESGVEGRVEVELGSGETLIADEGIYADRWQDLRELVDGPKTLIGAEDNLSVNSIKKLLSPSGAIQIQLTHSRAVGAGVIESFVLQTTRESGEKFDRHVLGHFFDQGRRSTWTLFLTTEEVESNQLIARKIRRVKQALNRSFSSEPWTAEGEKFLDSVVDESVQFEDGAVFQQGEPVTQALSAKGWVFMSDQWGVSAACRQLRDFLTIAPMVESQNDEVGETHVETAPSSDIAGDEPLTTVDP